MKPNINEVKINLDHLLWRTRSKGKDYQFVITPKSPAIDGWYSIFCEVFSSRLASRNPKNIIGKLGDSQFVATCFIDDKYLDSSGRPIKQYLIWFFSYDYDISEIKESLVNDWGKGFISSEGLYLPFYESSDTSELDKKKYINIEISGNNFQKLQYDDIKEIKCELPVRKPISPHQTKKESEETFEEAIEKAIEKGVDWASFDFINEEDRKSMGIPKIVKKYTPPTVKFYGIKKKIKKSPKERERFSRCLAESFKGNINDKFIEKIVEEYKSIAVKYVPSRQGTKGYDLILNVFKRYKKHEELLNKDESEGGKVVSECIKGASADDVCIHNIYLRLRELAKQDKGK